METLKFTKQIKSDWLNALKSGQYKQGAGRLIDDKGQYCCLGVLALIHPELSISEDNMHCIYENKEKNYEPFNEMLTEEIVDKLYKTNDNSYHKNHKRDYSEVIPLIEELPIID